MKRDSSKLFIMAGSLLGVVLLTAAVIYNGGQNAASRRSAGLPAPSPHIIRQLLSQSTRLFEEKRYPEAERSLKRILNLDRDNITAQRMLGNVYYMAGRYYDASNVFRAILARYPKDPVARNNLGQSMVRMQWYEAGIRELLAARAIDANLPGIDLNLSMAYKELGDDGTAAYYLSLAEADAKRRNHPAGGTAAEPAPAQEPDHE